MQWVCDYTTTHGGSFDGRHTKWLTEQRVDRDSACAVLHDLLGLTLELGLCFDQVDASNMASMEVVCRAYQLIEETGGSMQMEGLEHYVGRDVHGAGLRRGIALAPSLAAHATEQQSKQTGILKERRKAREEKAAAKSQPAGVCVCVGGG